MSLISECKLCPECECNPMFNTPDIYTEMRDVSYVSGEFFDCSADKELVTLKCSVCGYEVRAKSLRDAVAKWNKLSDENVKKNHIHKWVCKRCKGYFDEMPNADIYISESPLNEAKHMDVPEDYNGSAWSYKLPCCEYESGQYLSKGNCVKSFKKQFKEIELQRGIDDIKED